MYSSRSYVLPVFKVATLITDVVKINFEHRDKVRGRNLKVLVEAGTYKCL